MFNKDLLDDTCLQPLTNSDKISEEREDFTMHLKLKFPSKWEIYKFVPPVRNDGKPVEKSQIQYLAYSRFPDAVLIRKISEYKYKVFVIELKKNAKSKLRIIGEQLYSGLLHAVNLIQLSTIKTNSDTIFYPKVNINYEFVVFTGEQVKLLPINNRPIPGEPTNKNKRLNLYIEKNEIVHVLKNGKQKNFTVTNVTTNENYQNSNHHEVFESELVLR